MKRLLFAFLFFTVPHLFAAEGQEGVTVGKVSHSVLNPYAINYPTGKFRLNGSDLIEKAVTDPAAFRAGIGLADGSYATPSNIISMINASAGGINGAQITANSIAVSQLNFVPLTGGNIIASINASTEGLRISGSRITIDGTVTFANGYDPTTKLGIGGAAADINNGTTTINGGKITTNTITLNSLNFAVVQPNNVVASINATTEGIRIAGNRINIDGSVTFSSGYDPSQKIGLGGAAADINNNVTTIDGGKITTHTITANQIVAHAITAQEISAGTITAAQIATNSITVSNLNFTPVTNGNVIAYINASSEGIQIGGSKIAINGSTTFSSGYDPTTKVANGGAAADINGNTTTINGGKITTGSITANQIDANAILTNTVQSPNFNPGVAGWKVDKTGAAEFDSVVIRNGVTINTLTAPVFEQSPDGSTYSSLTSKSYSTNFFFRVRANVGSSVYFTTDGSAPNPTNPNAICITNSPSFFANSYTSVGFGTSSVTVTMRAKAFTGVTNSGTTNASWSTASDEVTVSIAYAPDATTLAPVSPPFLSGISGTWGSNTVSGTPTCSTSGATIMYSTTGNPPYTTYTSGTLSIPVGAELHLYATKTGMQVSTTTDYYNQSLSTDPGAGNHGGRLPQ